MNSKLKKYLLLGLAFALGFALALIVAKNLYRNETVRNDFVAGEETPRDLDEAALTAFLQAAEKGDYAAMEKTGPEVFQKGVWIPDAAARFDQYAANSYPPYTVYAFYSAGSDELIRRVLLTLNEDDRVESFMAEEMTVLK